MKFYVNKKNMKNKDIENQLAELRNNEFYEFGSYRDLWDSMYYLNRDSYQWSTHLDMYLSSVDKDYEELTEEDYQALVESFDHENYIQFDAEKEYNDLSCYYEANLAKEYLQKLSPEERDVVVTNYILNHGSLWQWWEELYLDIKAESVDNEVYYD